MQPGKRKTLKVEVERQALTYVFEGSGNFRAASQPFGVLTEKTDGVNEILVREQTGNRSLVCSIPATKSPCRPATRAFASARVRQADQGAGRLVRPHVMNSQAELRRALRS